MRLRSKNFTTDIETVSNQSWNQDGSTIVEKKRWQHYRWEKKMAALSLRKKDGSTIVEEKRWQHYRWEKKQNMCSSCPNCNLDKNVDENTSMRFWGEKNLQETKKYGLYHISTNKLCLFYKGYFFCFVRMTPQRF